MQDQGRKKIIGRSLTTVFALCLLAALRMPLVRAEAAEKTLTSTTLMYALTETDVYETPDTAGNVLGRLAANESLYAVELSGGWYRVVYLGNKGYVPQEALAEVSSAGGEGSAPAAGRAGMAAGSSGESSPGPESVSVPNEGEEREAVSQPEAGQVQDSTREPVQVLEVNPALEEEQQGSALTVLLIFGAVTVAVIAGAAAVLLLRKRRGGKEEK